MANNGNTPTISEWCSFLLFVGLFVCLVICLCSFASYDSSGVHDSSTIMTDYIYYSIANPLK